MANLSCLKTLTLIRTMRGDWEDIPAEFDNRYLDFILLDIPEMLGLDKSLALKAIDLRNTYKYRQRDENKTLMSNKVIIPLYNFLSELDDTQKYNYFCKYMESRSV